MDIDKIIGSEKMEKSKNKIIAIMCIAIMIMAVGYAYFATNLNITSTGSISSSWDVRFTNITNDTPVGSATNLTTPSYTATTATMSADLKLPGDSITYRITLKNNGDIGAIIEDIDASATGSGAIIFSISGLNIGDKLAGGDEKEIVVKIEYDPYTTSQPSETEKTLTVSIKAVQDMGQSIEPEAPSVNQTMLLSSAILKNNTTQSDENIDFVYTSEGCYYGYESDETDCDDSKVTNGLYYTSTNTEGNKTTYYFRGAVENNYVKFGKMNTCKYNGESVVHYDYENDVSTLELTKEQCLSTNVCYYGGYGEYFVGMTEEECNSFVGFEEPVTCQYNNMPVGYYNLEEGNWYSDITEEQCLSTNVCFYGDYGDVGIDEAKCTEWGGTWTGESATYETLKFYSDSKATYKENDDRLWRIVRINEDGSVRLVTQDAVGYSPFNVKYDDNAYVGYMYGTPGSLNYADTHANINDSTIKDYLDEWYINNLSSYTSLISTEAGFCNDRSMATTAGSWDQDDTALGYGKNDTYYGAYNRLENEYQPQFACRNASNDLFTTSTSSKGNKALAYPIGLITIDEVSYAGGVSMTANESYYLYTGSLYWTMSPVNFEVWRADAWFGGSHGFLGYTEVAADFIRVRPVVNLQSGVEIISGDGTSTNPYIIKTN